MKIRKVKYPNGTIKYFKANSTTLHRLYGPAIINPDDSEYWYKDGEAHREDGPAIISYREEFPFRIRCERWYLNGQLHREDGPAEFHSDSSVIAYWFHGQRAYDKEQFYSKSWRNRILIKQL